MKAVAFDMDGILINSELLKAKSYAIAVKSMKSDISESSVVKAYRDALGGTTMAVSASIADRFELNDDNHNETVRLLARRHRKAYNELIDDKSRITQNGHPEAIEALNLCCEKGIPTALVTGSSRRSMEAIVGALDIENNFDFILTADEVENTKPDPESYIRCCSYFDIDCSNLAVIEDSISGVQSAVQAGCFCIAVETDFTTAQLRESTIIERCGVVTDHPNLPNEISNLID